MTDWLEESLAVSISEMRELGMSSIADDLGRLLSSGSLADIQLYRNRDLSAASQAIDEITDISDMKNCLHGLADVLGVDHMTLHCCSAKAASTFNVRVVTTYPKSWVASYVDRGFSNVDPVLSRAQTSHTGFYWDSIDFRFPLVAEFRQAAIAAGIGPSGYTLPVSFSDGIRIACTVTSHDEPEAFRERFSRQEHDLRLLLEELGEVFFNIVDRVPTCTAALDQLRFKVLLGLARGSELSRLCRDLEVDPDKITARICEFYGARTLCQALAVSIQSGHLDEWPFEIAEIQH
jgi:hypothetical protein